METTSQYLLDTDYISQLPSIQLNTSVVISYLSLQLRFPLYISQYVSAVVNISLSLATTLSTTQYHFSNSLVTSYIVYNCLCRIATLHHTLFVLLISLYPPTTPINTPHCHVVVYLHQPIMSPIHTSHCSATHRQPGGPPTAPSGSTCLVPAELMLSPAQPMYVAHSPCLQEMRLDLSSTCRPILNITVSKMPLTAETASFKVSAKSQNDGYRFNRGPHTMLRIKDPKVSLPFYTDVSEEHVRIPIEKPLRSVCSDPGHDPTSWCVHRWTYDSQIPTRYREQRLIWVTLPSTSSHMTTKISHPRRRAVCLCIKVEPSLPTTSQMPTEILIFQASLNCCTIMAPSQILISRVTPVGTMNPVKASATSLSQWPM